MYAAKLLVWLERRAPSLAPRLKRWFVERLVPLNRSIGLRLDSVDGGRVLLRLPVRRGNENASGSVHGGVLLAFAETAHGVAVLWRFPPASHRMVTCEARVEYLAPARGQLRTAFQLDHAVASQIEADLAALGKSRFTLESSVVDGLGCEVARLRATYDIRRRHG